MIRIVMASLLLSLAACSAQSDGSKHLAPSTWQFTQIDDDDPASSDAELSFDQDRIGANVGCNGLGGPWRIEDGRLIAGPLSQTRMLCQGQVGDQERAVSALLAGAPRVTIDGNSLLLQSSGHSAKLTRLR